MTATALTRPSLRDMIDLPVLRKFARLFSPSTGDLGPEDARTRRDFISDMLTANPDAFSSDLDVQAMMQMMPERF